MGVDNLFDNGQPQSRSLHSLGSDVVGAIKLFEDPRDGFLRNSYSVVLDLYPDKVTGVGRTEFDPSVNERVFDGICHKVPQKLVDSIGVSVNPRQGGRKVLIQSQAFLHDVRLLFFNDLVRYLGMPAGYGTFALGVVISSAAVALLNYRGVQISEKSALIDLIVQMIIVAA